MGEERRVDISCVWSPCGHIGGHNVISRCEIEDCIFHIPMIRFYTHKNCGTCSTGGRIAVEEVPMISFPSHPNPPQSPPVWTSLCNVRKNCVHMPWTARIPFISLINRIPRSTHLIYKDTPTSATRRKHLSILVQHTVYGTLSVYLFSGRVQPPPIFSHQTGSSSHSEELPPTFHAPPISFSGDDTRHCSTNCEFTFSQCRVAGHQIILLKTLN